MWQNAWGLACRLGEERPQDQDANKNQCSRWSKAWSGVEEEWRHGVRKNWHKIRQVTSRAFRRSGGTGAAARPMQGARHLSLWNWKHERVPATGLALLWTDKASKEKEMAHCPEHKKHFKIINLESREAPENRTATTDSLSHRNLTCLEDRWGPHNYAATSMGKS